MDRYCLLPMLLSSLPQYGLDNLICYSFISCFLSSSSPLSTSCYSGVSFSPPACLWWGWPHAISSFLLGKMRWAMILFGVYVVGLIAAVLLQPVLSISPGLSPEINRLFFVINIIWMTGSCTYCKWRCPVHLPKKQRGRYSSSHRGRQYGPDGVPGVCTETWL